MLGLHLTVHASLEKKNVVLTKSKFNTRQTSYANKRKKKRRRGKKKYRSGKNEKAAGITNVLMCERPYY